MQDVNLQLRLQLLQFILCNCEIYTLSCETKVIIFHTIVLISFLTVESEWRFTSMKRNLLQSANISHNTWNFDNNQHTNSILLHWCKSIVAGNYVRFWLRYRDNHIRIIRVHKETRGIRRSCFSHASNPVWCGISSPAWLDLGQARPQKKDIRQIPQQIKIEHLLCPYCQVSDNRSSSESLL